MESYPQANHLGKSPQALGVLWPGALKVEDKALIVLPAPDANVVMSARNIPNVKTLYVNTLNVYDIIKYDKFIVTKEAVQKIGEVYV